MRNWLPGKLIWLLIPCLFLSFQPTNKAIEIINELKQHYNLIKDYKADVTIKVNIEFLKIPISKAKVYFKWPDKIKIDSKGFSMIPKTGLNFANTTMLQGKYEALFIKEELINKEMCNVVKIIPIEESDVLLSTIWINKSNAKLVKFISTSQSNGTFQGDILYDNQKPELYIPKELKISFDLDKIQMPMGITGDMSGGNNKSKNAKKVTRGEVYIYYNNVVVNTGITDAFFKEGKK
jgi:hypothetical protein